MKIKHIVAASMGVHALVVSRDELVIGGNTAGEVNYRYIFGTQPAAVPSMKARL
jgi:hypothetical protein